jgi:hypothetical protein
VRSSHPPRGPNPRSPPLRPKSRTHHGGHRRATGEGVAPRATGTLRDEPIQTPTTCRVHRRPRLPLRTAHRLLGPRVWRFKDVSRRRVLRQHIEKRHVVEDDDANALSASGGHVDHGVSVLSSESLARNCSVVSSSARSPRWDRRKRSRNDGSTTSATTPTTTNSETSELLGAAAA